MDSRAELVDSRMTSKIEEEGRRMLRSVVFSNSWRPSFYCSQRIIAELAEKLDLDLIMMGRTGIGNSQVEVGHVTSKVLRPTSKPVLMYK